MMEENLPVLIRSASGDAFDLDNVTDVQDVVVQLLCTHMLLEVLLIAMWWLSLVSISFGL